MATTAALIILLTVFSPTLCDEEVENENVHWSSITPLKLAVIDGRAEEVEDILLQKKESANSVSGMSPLHWAAALGHVPVIQTLFRFGADVGSLDDDQNTALHMAAVSGSPDAILELVHAGVDLNARNRNGSTALHLAVGKQDFQVVWWLLRLGAFTNITDREGRTTLDLALETSNPTVIALLRASGAESIKHVNERYGETDTTPSTTEATTTIEPPKKQFSKLSKVPEVRMLTEEEMRLHRAASKSSDNAIVDLCAEGIDPNVADVDNNGFTPLHIAATTKAVAVILALARCSANLNAKDFEGNTPLHIVAKKGNYPWSADMLLLLGADPNITNNDGKTPKDLLSSDEDRTTGLLDEDTKWIRGVRPLSARERELLRLIKYGYYVDIAEACEGGVDVRVKDADNKLYTFLHYAVTKAESNIPGTVQMLIRCGADVNARNVDGDTPLHLALPDQQEAARVLLLNGADPYIANHLGKTPYDILHENDILPADSRLQWYMNRMLL